MGASESKFDPTAIHSTPPQDIRIPQSLHLNFQSGWKLRLQLTEAENERDHNPSSPCYTVDLPGAWYGPLHLYNGPVSPSTLLATVETGGKWSKAESRIALPGLYRPGREHIEETMRTEGTLRSKHVFTALVGQDPNALHPEQFEWRHADRSEAKTVGESGEGWKLVRMQDEQVVAIWAWPSMTLSLSKWKKAGAFRFVGPATTGEMGHVFALMAVVTFLRLWQLRMILINSASSGAS